MQLSGIAIATGAMGTKRTRHAVAPGPMGLILICGGLDQSGNPLASAELYNPATGQCVATGNMTAPRYGHAAVLLTDGRVLVIGGQTTGGAYLASCEYFYSPGMRLGGTFVAGTTGLSAARSGHTAWLTTNGQVLVAGGADSGDAALNLTELYVPATAAEMIGVAPNY